MGVPEAIVLCGGLGTRLRSVVSDRPKCMALVRGRPFLEWIVLGLARRGVRRAVLATGYLGQDIEDHFRRGCFGVDLRCSREDRPMGTAGSARLASALTAGEPVLVLNGDSYCDFDLDAMLNAHRGTGALATIWLARVALGDPYGAVELGAHGEVRGFREKAASAPGLVSAGVYLMTREVLTRIPRGRSMSLERDVFPTLVSEERLHGVTGEGPFLDIGTPEAFRDAAVVLDTDLSRLEAR